ncbi:hypothetical protein EVAR_99505_1 [Eumeta japonica]|uniref:Uncharacterized protein n=1 Tax=Eumeta variegata TaxID=151549 RepID=A0A4C1Z6Y4_EUMVA|nr:hypothetical protein EVAR_99505_1 [Eumeta japonica]
MPVIVGDERAGTRSEPVPRLARRCLGRTDNEKLHGFFVYYGIIKRAISFARRNEHNYIKRAWVIMNAHGARGMTSRRGGMFLHAPTRHRHAAGVSPNETAAAAPPPTAFAMGVHSIRYI